jgi:hypothetical protein
LGITHFFEMPEGDSSGGDKKVRILSRRFIHDNLGVAHLANKLSTLLLDIPTSFISSPWPQT